MKLYTARYSSSSRRVGLTTSYLGLVLEEVQVDLRDPTDRAALLAINPNNKIPVLIDGDLVLWESHAIMQYLCASTPGQTLYPDQPRARAEVDRWLFWVASHLSPTVGPISFERLWKKAIGGGEPDAAVIARHEGFFHQHAQVLDRHLADRAWIAADRVTLADFSVAATLMYMRPTRLPIEAYKNVLAHFGRVAALEAWKRTEPPPMAW